MSYLSSILPEYFPNAIDQVPFPATGAAGSVYQRIDGDNSCWEMIGGVWTLRDVWISPQERTNANRGLVFNGASSLDTVLSPDNVNRAPGCNLAVPDFTEIYVGKYSLSYTGTRAVVPYNDLIAISPGVTYGIFTTIKHKIVMTTNTFYTALMPYDADQKVILPSMVDFRAGTGSFLTRALAPGDTKIYVANTVSGAAVSAWQTAAIDFVGVFNYVSAKGIVYPGWNTFAAKGAAGPYTQYTAKIASVATVGSEIEVTLGAPYTGNAAPIGTPAANMVSGGTYIYPYAQQPVTDVWKVWRPDRNAATSATSGLFGYGIPNRPANVSPIRPFTCFVKPAMLVNYITPANVANTTYWHMDIFPMPI